MLFAIGNLAERNPPNPTKTHLLLWTGLTEDPIHLERLRAALAGDVENPAVVCIQGDDVLRLGPTAILPDCGAYPTEHSDVTCLFIYMLIFMYLNGSFLCINI